MGTSAHFEDGGDSVEESRDSDSLSPEHEVDAVHTNECTAGYMAGNDGTEMIENEHLYGHRNGDEMEYEEETSDDDAVGMLRVNAGNDRLRVDKDREIERLQLRLKQMSAAMVALRERNDDLEASKVSLITNTAKAMDDCRNTVRRLNQQNLDLLRLLDSTQKT